MFAGAILLGFAMQAADLPKQVDLRAGYERYGLTVCNQNGPLCWDYTVVGLLEYELASEQREATRLSPGFLAWAATATDHESGAGSNFGRAYRGLEKYGIAPLSLGGDPNGDGVGQVPTEQTLRAAAAVGRIDVHWIRFWNNRDPLTDEQLHSIESEISHGHPVAVGMRWPNQTTFSPGSDFLLNVPAPGAVFDGHCVALVGYRVDPSLPGGGAFLFRNSWGANWADHGYAWMPFQLLKSNINDSLSVRVEPRLTNDGARVATLRCAELAVTSSKGAVPITQEMARFGQGWQAKKQLYFPAKAAGQSFGLSFAATTSGRYEIRLIITKAEDFGIFSVSVNGSTSKEDLDGSGPGISLSNSLPCGTFSLHKGMNRIDFSVVGHDSASSGYGLGLDSLQIIPIESQ